MLDTDRELLSKIRLGEDSVLELKEVFFKGDRIQGPDADALADELAAMANSNDGMVVLGVSDRSREVTGVPLEKLNLLEAWVRQIGNDRIRPPLPLRILRMELPDAGGELRPVLKVEVSKSLFVHSSPGGYFRRHGSAKQRLEPEQLARFFQQRSQARLIRFDEQAVPETSIEDLDRELVGRLLSPDVEGDLTPFLRKLRLLTRDDSGAERLSVAGVLLATRHPEQWLPSALIEAVHYGSTCQDSHYQVDARTLTGPLDVQIREALFFVRRNMFVPAVKTPWRTEVPQYSLRAAFEAIVNAVAHRDYSVAGSKIRLFLFLDRLELYCPGALPNSVTIDSLPFRQATRNELITSLLARVPVEEMVEEVRRQRIMDRRGEGVPVILRESLALSGREPVYRMIDDVELQLTIWAAKSPHDPPGEPPKEP